MESWLSDACSLVPQDTSKGSGMRGNKEQSYRQQVDERQLQNGGDDSLGAVDEHGYESIQRKLEIHHGLRDGVSQRVCESEKMQLGDEHPWVQQAQAIGAG